MFRYLGLAWNESHPTSAARARQLAASMRTRSGWEAALVRPGLEVFTTGTRAGVNGVHLLGGQEGVLVGKIFRRSDRQPHVRKNVTLTRQEAEDILQSQGRALVRQFWGRYVAFFRTASGSIRVLRDPLGTLPCFLIRDQGVSIVFSWLEDALAMLSDVQAPGVNWDAVEAFLLMGALGGRETALEGVSRVLPGELVDLASGDSTLLWSAVDIARSLSTHRADEAEMLLRESVRDCARAWASCYDTVLLRLSGGVDSSILLSCLDPGSTSADVICVNYHSPGSDSDERVYARLASARAGRDLIERERDPAFRIERVSTIARTPDPVNYIGRMNSRTDARLASAHAAGAMFSGTGGDPLFFEYPRWWPAADYLRLKGWDAGFLAAAMDAARLGRVSVWKAIALALAQRMRPDLAAGKSSAHAATFLAQGKGGDSMIGERFVHPDLRRSTLPIGKHTQAAALMQPLGYYEPFEQTSAPELVAPLVSQPLVELCLGLPTFVLTQGGRGRALARRAFASSLPPQIATRRSKGGMEEHIKAVLLSNLDFARTMLVEGQLVRRGLLDRAMIEELLADKPTARAGALGQIHVFVGVEVWLSRWAR